MTHLTHLDWALETFLWQKGGKGGKGQFKEDAVKEVIATVWIWVYLFLGSNFPAMAGGRTAVTTGPGDWPAQSRSMSLV